MCACEPSRGYVCRTCRDLEARLNEPWDYRDYLDGLSGVSSPWHDADSEGMCAVTVGIDYARVGEHE